MRAAFYRGTRPGLQGIYSRAVRCWTRSPFSHCELVFADGLSASSSFVDGGVRFKRIDFDPAHWDFVEIDGDETRARQWFADHEGRAYDLIGNAGFIIGPIRDGSDKWSCAESIADALGYLQAWRYSPAILHSVISNKRQ